MTGFFQSPEEFIAHMREHQAHSEMSHEIMSHDIRDFIDGLDAKQLEVFDILLRAFENEGSRWHVRGRVMEARRKFGVCPCGADHNQLPEDMVPDPVPDPVLPEDDGDHRDDRTEVEITAERVTNMALYGIEPNPDYGMEDWEQRYETVPQPFRCSNCGMGYVSLEDRMLRPPGIDGCGGCRLKSAHG